MKKILSTVFAALLIGGSLMQGALADELLIAPAPAPVSVDEQIIKPAYEQATGTVESIDAAGKTFVIAAADGKLLLRVDERTRILDNATQKAAAFGEIKAGDKIRVWYDSAVKFEVATIVSAHVIVAGIKDEISVGQYFEVEKVEKTKQGYKLLNQEQDLYYTVPANTKIPVIGKSGKGDTIRPSAIKPGTKLVVWYEIVALSYPGQTGGSTLAAFPYDYAGYVSLVGDKLVVNGSKVRARTCETCASYVVPVEAVAKKLGIKAKWNKAASTLTLVKGSNSVVLTAGKDQLTLNGKNVQTLAPVVQSGKLYAQMSVFSLLGNYKLANPIR